MKHDIARIYTIMRERELGITRSDDETTDETTEATRPATTKVPHERRDHPDERAQAAVRSREGLVLSDKMDKTMVVSVEDRVKHALYGKVLRRTSKLKVHDETNQCGIGDRVLIMETRPLSATKRWRVVEVLEKAK